MFYKIYFLGLALVGQVYLMDYKGPGWFYDNDMIELNKEQITEFKRTFPQVVRDPTNLIETLLLELFRIRPDYLTMFDKFSDVPLHQLPANHAFQAHAARVARALGAVVNLLEDPEKMKSVLVKLGGDHKKFGVTPQHFWTLGDILISLVADEIDNEQSELLSLYKLVLGKIFNILAKASS